MGTSGRIRGRIHGGHDVRIAERRLWWEAQELTDNKNKGGLGPARKPSPGTCRDNKPQNNGPLSTYSNESASNNICDICGGNHNILVIPLENGGRIITRPFTKEKVTRVKVGSQVKGRGYKTGPS